MTRFFAKTMLTAGLSVLLGGLTLSAQSTALVADIPFAFHAEGKVMPAGSYRVNTASQQGIFQFTNVEAKVSGFLNAPIPRHYKPSDSKLTFVRYGSDYILTEVSVAGNEHTNAVSDSEVQKNLTRKLGLAGMISVPLHTR